MVNLLANWMVAYIGGVVTKRMLAEGYRIVVDNIGGCTGCANVQMVKMIEKTYVISDPVVIQAHRAG